MNSVPLCLCRSDRQNAMSFFFSETSPPIAAGSPAAGDEAEDAQEHEDGPASTCMNCQAPLRGEYCHRCGQPARTQRLRFRQLAASFLRGLFDLDSKTLRTTWHLCARPGSMTREYVEGNRVTYLSPLRYYILIVALNIGLSALLGTTDVASAGANNGRGFWDAHFVSLQISVVYALLAVPIAAGQWLLHWRRRLTLAEHYAFLLYLLGQSILVLAVIDIFVLLTTGAELSGDAEGLTWLGVFTVYIVGAGRTFYREAPWHTAWKTVVSYVTAALALGSCAAAGMLLYQWVVG